MSRSLISQSHTAEAAITLHQARIWRCDQPLSSQMQCNASKKLNQPTRTWVWQYPPQPFVISGCDSQNLRPHHWNPRTIVNSIAFCKGRTWFDSIVSCKCRSFNSHNERQGFFCGFQWQALHLCLIPKVDLLCNFHCPRPVVRVLGLCQWHWEINIVILPAILNADVFVHVYLDVWFSLLQLDIRRRQHSAAHSSTNSDIFGQLMHAYQLLAGTVTLINFSLYHNNFPSLC